MVVRIAALAPKDLLAPILDIAEELPSLVVVPCGYDDANETESLLEGVSGGVDGYLFNGPLPARIASAILPAGFAGATVRYDIAAVANSLFRILREMPEAFDTGVSLDCLGAREVDDLTAELGFERDRFRRYDLRNPWEHGSVAEYHRYLLRTRRVAAAAIGLRAAYRQLQSEGLPVFDVRPTRSAIRDALTELVVRIRSSPESNDPMAVMVVALSDPPPTNALAAWRSIARYLRRLLSDRNLLEYRAGERVLVITGSSSQLGSLMGHNANGHLHLRIQRATGLRVRLGYGEAAAMPEAKRRALLALEVVQATGAYAVTSYHDAKLADEVTRAADAQTDTMFESRSSVPVKNAILQARAVRLQLGRTTVTAADVASALGVTTRTGRRLLLAWSDCGIAQFSATRRQEPVGRPAQVYELRI
jgi:hypothetical protein